MPLNNDGMAVAANALIEALAYAQLHTAAAGTNGTSNLTTAGREAITWGTPTNDGDFGLDAPIDFTGGANNGPVYSVTLWSAASNGTFYGEFILAGDATFSGSGGYSVTAIDFDGAATV